MHTYSAAKNPHLKYSINFIKSHAAEFILVLDVAVHTGDSESTKMRKTRKNTPPPPAASKRQVAKSAAKSEARRARSGATAAEAAKAGRERHGGAPGPDQPATTIQ
jgi:hypothetical protein